MSTQEEKNLKDPVAASVQITLSIVSHGQATLIRSLLADLAELPELNFEVVITINLPEDDSPYKGHPFPLRIIRNDTPKGFGANHNAAFHVSQSPYFAVVNPDIRLGMTDPTSLLDGFTDPLTAVCAPLVINSLGEVEDSARRFPTMSRLILKALGWQTHVEYPIEDKPLAVDWVAGMFAVFRREAYLDVSGFDDQRYFMYYEDVDICYRLNKRGWMVILLPAVRVIHDAQRASHRNARHMRWHATSLLRFLSGW